MNNRNFSSGIVTFMMGVLTGAATVYLMDEKNRALLKQRVSDVNDEAAKKLAELKDAVQGAEKGSKKKLAGNLRKMAEQLEG